MNCVRNLCIPRGLLCKKIQCKNPLKNPLWFPILISVQTIPLNRNCKYSNAKYKNYKKTDNIVSRCMMPHWSKTSQALVSPVGNIQSMKLLMCLTLLYVIVKDPICMNPRGFPKGSVEKLKSEFPYPHSLLFGSHLEKRGDFLFSVYLVNGRFLHKNI